MEAKGHNGTMTFDGYQVVIQRSGFRARTTVGVSTKSIPLQSITAVQWKPAGMMVNGFIALTVPGGNERNSQFGRQTFDAVRDENAVLFTKQQMPTFERLRAEIESALVHGRAPRQAGQGYPQVSVADELQKLAALVQQGLLTPDEFNAQKARLLGHR